VLRARIVGPMKRLHIFRAGKHLPLAGRALEFAAADLEATARAYDPAKHEAPIVIGHPALNAPAFGWIASLEAEADGLHATPKQVEAAFAAAVEAGRFKKISASFWQPDAADNPTPGVWALRHVGFLGAAVPAVTGLKPVAFAAEAQGVVTVEFAAPSFFTLGWLLSDVAGLFRGLRDRLIAKEGLEAADAALPSLTVQRIAEEAGRIQQMDAPSPAFAAPPVTDPPASPAPPEETRVSQDLAAREAELKKREAEIAAREAAVASQQKAARQAAATDFAARLVKEARLPQGLAPSAAALLASLPEEGVVSFAAGDGKTVEQAPAALFRDLLSKLPATVSFGALGDRAPAEAPGGVAEFAGHRVDGERMELHRKALAYQRQHDGCDYEAAVRAVAGES
jgi:hypothetical protein